MSTKVLDETGLAYFWEKIKDYVDAHGGGSEGEGMPNFVTQQFSTTVTVSSGYGSFSIPVSKTGYVPFGILSYSLNSSYYSFIALKLDLSQNEITGTVRHITNASASGSQTVYITVLFIGSGSIGLLKSDVINNLSSTITDQPLSAAQGKALNDKISPIGNFLYASGNKTTAADSDSYTDVVSINLPAGMWVITGDAHWASNSSDAVKKLKVIASNSNAYSTQQVRTQWYTETNATLITKTTAAGTAKVQAASNIALGVTGIIRAVRII